eukprot:6629475-Prymnesium_polylepis.1
MASTCSHTRAASPEPLLSGGPRPADVSAVSGLSSRARVRSSGTEPKSSGRRAHGFGTLKPPIRANFQLEK